MKRNKFMNGKAYGSIAHLSGSYVAAGDKYVPEGMNRIATIKKRDKHDNIIVQEKLDGSCMGIYKKDNQIYAISRTGYLAIDSPFMFQRRFTDWVHLREDLWMDMLQNGERLMGEWMAMTHGTRYNLPGLPFMPFDIMKDKERIPHAEFAWRIFKYVTVYPPYLVNLGDAIDPLVAYEKMGNGSAGAVDKPEGLVYRIERKGKIDFLAKWIRPDHQPGKYLVGISDVDKPRWNTWNDPLFPAIEGE